MPDNNIENDHKKTKGRVERLEQQVNEILESQKKLNIDLFGDPESKVGNFGELKRISSLINEVLENQNIIQSSEIFTLNESQIKFLMNLFHGYSWFRYIVAFVLGFASFIWLVIQILKSIFENIK